MLTRGFSVFLAFLRIAAGLSLLLAGLHKLAWFRSPPLQQMFAGWSAHAANPLVAKYLGLVAPHHGLLAKLVVVGELGLGALLVAGFLTPLAALLGFLMVLQFQFASSAMFSLDYLGGQSGLAYLLVFPVLFFGRAGTALGVDGMLSRGGGGAQRKPGA